MSRLQFAIAAQTTQLFQRRLPRGLVAAKENTVSPQPGMQVGRKIPGYEMKAAPGTTLCSRQQRRDRALYSHEPWRFAFGGGATLPK